MNLNINEILIEPCFNALLEVSKPESELRLELELLSSKSGAFAVQKRGSKIIESFPWPISKELTHLFSSSYNVRDQNRILKIFHIAERFSQFLSFCWLIQLWDAKIINPDLELTADFKTQFRNFGRPGIGNYLGLIRSTSNILFDANQPVFFKESDLERKTRDLIKEIEKLTVIRNKEIHFKQELMCEDAEEILANIMVHAAFLANYPMVSIKDINVSKHKLTEVKYVHCFDHLNSQRSEFSGSFIELDKFSESFSVLLIENLQNMGTYLNLSPFIINTEPFLAARGRSKVLQGIYMYSEKESNNIQYSFVNESDIQDLKDMPQNQIFENQWNNLFQILS